MDDESLSKHDGVLLGLVLSLQAAAFQQLGKVKNPLTDRLERDLEQARATIDVLEMLKAKCRAGTAEPVLRLLDTAVMELQMNYLDESRKQRRAAAESAAAGVAGAPSGADSAAGSGAGGAGAGAAGADTGGAGAAGPGTAAPPGGAADRAAGEPAGEGA